MNVIKKEPASITRSPGIVVSSGYIVGGGQRGYTQELDDIVQKEAEELRNHYGVDVTIRFNSDRLSGGAWLVDSSKDTIGSNSSIGLGAKLVNSKLASMSLDELLDLPHHEHYRLRHDPDTIIFTTAIDTDKTLHCVSSESKRMLFSTEYCDFKSFEEARDYLFSHAFGLKEKAKESLDSRIQNADQRSCKSLSSLDGNGRPFVPEI